MFAVGLEQIWSRIKISCVSLLFHYIDNLLTFGFLTFQIVKMRSFYYFFEMNFYHIVVSLNGILLPNFFWLLWEKIVLVIEKKFWNSRLKAENFEITRTIYSTSERSEQFLLTECFFNLILEVSHTYLLN